MTEHPPSKRRIKTNLDQKKGHARNKRLIILMIILLGALIIYNPMKNFIVGKLVRYETAQWKVLEQSVPEEGVVIRTETLIPAPESGEFEPLVPEGEKVAVGRIIGYVKTYAGTDKVDLIKIPVKAPVAGLVSYHPDGLEDVLTADLLNNLDIDKIADLLEEKKEGHYSFPKVEKGKAFCKIIDNLVNPLLYLQFSEQSKVSTIEKGQVMSVRFPEEIVTKLVVRDLKQGDHRFVMMTEIFDAPDLNLEKRFVPVDLIINRHEGVVVQAKAIVQENGEDGVFVARKGRCKWVKVEIMGQVDGEVVVSGLDQGSQYIVNTSLVRPDQRIY